MKDKTSNQNDLFFHNSLHYTAHGMPYWYDQAQGGLETVTGIAYADLGCKNCHISSCCHFETLVKEGKRVAIPVFDWLFLMNYDGKMTSANMQTFVVEHDKTFLMFANQFSHSVMNKGRNCEECHATETVRQVQKGQVNLTWMENGEIRHIHGVIPVVDGVQWKFVSQDRENERWIPIQNPVAPVMHYAGYGSPLSKEQLKRLSLAQKSE